MMTYHYWHDDTRRMLVDRIQRPLQEFRRKYRQEPVAVLVSTREKPDEVHSIMGLTVEYDERLKPGELWLVVEK